jgi:hypothetical protein
VGRYWTSEMDDEKAVLEKNPVPEDPEKRREQKRA